MAELFASILLREGEEYFLVSPAEKVRIRVVDCAFYVTGLRVEAAGDQDEQCVYLTTSLGEEVRVDQEHALVCRPGPRPTVHVRSGLTALVARSVYYQLAEFAVAAGAAGGEQFGVWSGGDFFLLE